MSFNGGIKFTGKESVYVCMCALKGRAGSYLVLVIIKRHHVHHQHILDFGVQPHHCDSAAGKHASEEINMTGKNKT